MDTRLKAFSLVELLAALSVMLALGLVAFAYGNNYKSGSENTKRLGDIATLGTVAESYFKTKGEYPTPRANTIPYDKDGRYSHDNSTIYGYSSFVSEDLFGAEFLHDIPRDPSNNAYYAYGKQVPGKESPNGSYDFATIDLNEGTYYAYVRGNYDGARLTSLVRAYNSAEFVQNGGNKYLPYDPNEIKMTGRITSSSGMVAVIKDSTDASASDFKSGDAVYTGDLIEGNRVVTTPGSWATMHFSDGSEIRLGGEGVGGQTMTGKLDIKSLEYQDRGLLTKLYLKIQEGQVWAKAPKLRNDNGNISVVDIETESAVAAVRGTVFGVVQPSGQTTGQFYIRDGEITISPTEGNTAISNLSLTGSNGTYRTVDIPLVRSTEGGVAGTQDHIIIPSILTGGTATGTYILENTKQWDSFIISKKPDITSLEKTSTGIIVQANIAEEEVGSNFCFGVENSGALSIKNAVCSNIDQSGAITLNFIEKNESTITVGWVLENVSDYLSYTGSLFKSSDNSYNFSFALCKDDTCSAIKTITVTGDMKVSNLDTSTNCDTKNAWGPLGCMSSDTIAYAPYDKVGDLNMYYKGESFYNNEKISMLPVKTNGWIQPGSMGNDMTMSIILWELLNTTSIQPINQTSTGTNIYQDRFSYHRDFSKFSDLSYINKSTNAVGDISFTGITNDAFQESNNNGVIIGNGKTYTIGGGAVATSTGGYLAYNLSPLGLSESFGIEISVRSEALNRTNTNYFFLANSWPTNTSDLGSANFRLFFLANTGLHICNIKTCSTINTTEIKNLQLQPDIFYTIQYKKENSSTGVFSIISPSGQSLITKKITNDKSFKSTDWYSYVTNLPFINTSINSWTMDLFIGGWHNSTLQWNDPIGFVKIYRY